MSDAQTGQATPPVRPLLHIGLTGGIASGKSTVSAELARRGAVVVDADSLARSVVAPGTPGLEAVRKAFGPRVIAADGGMDRVAVARIVFAEPAARERLNGIIHPLVRATGRRLAAEAGPDAVVVQDVPLLVETGQTAHYDLVLVIEADPEERVARMVRDRDMTEAEARSRIDAQATDAQRRAAADVVIVNDAGLEDLVRATGRFWDTYVAPVQEGRVQPGEKVGDSLGDSAGGPDEVHGALGPGSPGA